MGKKIIGIGLAALLLLSTGCASMLNRDYSSVAPHSATPVAEGDLSLIHISEPTRP